MARTPDTDDIGRRLRRLRRDRGLSQRELSTDGVSAGYISRIEAGTRRPSPHALRALAEKLNVDPVVLEVGDAVLPESMVGLRVKLADLRAVVGDPAAAVREAEALVTEAAAMRDRALTHRAKLALARAHLAAGSPRETVRVLKATVEEGIASAADETRAYRLLADAYAADGAVDPALELLREQLERATRDGRGVAATRLQHAIVSIAARSGRDGEGLTVAEADPADDGSWSAWARARFDEAAAALDNRQIAEATEAATEALSLLAFAADMRDRSIGHRLRALAALREGDTGRARAELGRAQQLVHTWGTGHDRVSILVEESRLTRDADAAYAESRAREAYDIAVAQDLPADAGRAAGTLGEILASRGETEEAIALLRESLELLTTARRPSELLGSARVLARVLRGAGRDAEALDVFETASAAAVEIAEATTASAPAA